MSRPSGDITGSSTLNGLLQKTEAQKLSSAGIKLFTVYEDTGHNLTLNAAASGHRDGGTQSDGKSRPYFFAEVIVIV